MVLDIHWNSHELEVGFSKHYRWKECHGCFKSLQIGVKMIYTLRIISTEQTLFGMCPFLTTVMICLKSILVKTWEERRRKK